MSVSMEAVQIVNNYQLLHKKQNLNEKNAI